MNGTVLEVYKNYVKVKTPIGERILKMKGKAMPERGWILEFKDSDPTTPFVGSVVLDSMNPLPPLKEIIPIIEGIGTGQDSFDIVFLSEVTRMVQKRLGDLPRWYYRRLGEYYKYGEVGKDGVFSDVVYEALKDLGVRRVKPDPNDAFGDWLNHLSHPYYFRSKSDFKRPMRLFVKRGSPALFRLDRMTKRHGRVVMEGTLGPSDGKIKVLAEKPLSEDELATLKRSLEEIYNGVFIVQGGGFLGYR